MITNFLIALLTFFNLSFGQIDNTAGKGNTKDNTPTKTIIVDITP